MADLRLGAGGAVIRTDAFLTAVRREMSEGSLTPTTLARVVTTLLPVDAAGLTTMVDGLRLPLGGSDEAAFEAERLQTTLGDGPCLSAAHASAALIVSGAEIHRRWPVYADLLEARTPFRSVAAIPLGPPGEVVGALDLYAVDPDLGDRLDVTEVAGELGVALATLLAVCLAQVPDADEAAHAPTPWWYQQSAGRRHQVWIAAGMLLAYGGSTITSGADALVLLRGYAFSHDLSLDDLAAELVTGRLDVDDLYGGRP